MITYQVEGVDAVYTEIQNLINMNWEEVGVLKNETTLSPSYELYKHLEKAEKLYIFTVRDDTLLIGYYIAFLTSSVHFTQEKLAYNDTMFLHPEHRKGMLGYMMIKKAEEGLKAMGVTINSISTKINHPLDAIMSRLGYTPNEIHYVKKL